MDAGTFGAWMATGLTLFIFSFLYKDNPLFKLAEHLYVGVSVGYTIVKAYDTVIVHLIVKPIVEQGEIVIVEVTEAHDYDLVGKVVERPDPKTVTHTPRHAPLRARVPAMH